MTVVVQQHLGGHGSRLAPVVRRRTGQEVVWAEDGMPLREGRVLVTPVVLAQGEAEHPPMPQAALEAGADLSLPLDGITAVVTRIVRGGALPGPR